jgi:ABC-type amino acid transport system permease subunit
MHSSSETPIKKPSFLFWFALLMSFVVMISQSLYVDPSLGVAYVLGAGLSAPIFSAIFAVVLAGLCSIFAQKRRQTFGQVFRVTCIALCFVIVLLNLVDANRQKEKAELIKSIREANRNSQRQNR